MAREFDPSKQEELAKWETGQGDNDLVIGVYRYNGGEPKMGMNRYFIDKEGNSGIKKAGRLNYEDVQFLEETLPKVMEVMGGAQ